jgi:DNA polymerase-3 subunit delta
MGDNNHITLEDIEEIRIGPVETSLDTFCHAFASLQMAQASSLMNQLQGEGVNIIGILRSLAKYFLRLYYVRSKIDAGIKEAEAISSLTPPLFFKHIPTFTHHVKKWNNDKIILLLEELSELEVKCKKTGAPTNLLCEHLIYKWSCNTYILKANNVEKA